MPEILLHYIWQKLLFSGYPQQTTDGRAVRVLSSGEHNLHSGPDFRNVHLLIGEQEWIGEVEIHVSSSDWYRHKHHLDPAYDRLVLHVVRHADKMVFNSNGDPIAQMVLNYPMDRDYLTGLLRDAFDMDSPFAVHPCSRRLLTNPNLLTAGWRQVLLEQRLECKRQSILKILEIMHGSWEQAFYITLSRNFGFHTNSLPMEQLAIQTPLACLQKHHNSLFQLTALLLGQSGLLNPAFNPGGEGLRPLSAEEEALWHEYEFLSTKFSLVPLEGRIWKRGRVRPANSPENRIRQFAHLIWQSEFLFSRLMDAEDLETMVSHLSLREVEADLAVRVRPALPLGRDSIDVIIMNTAIPYQYAYALARGGEPHKTLTTAVARMAGLPAESNTIIRQWRELGQTIRNAADTQALIHLYQNYCQPHQCVACDVGYQIFLTNGDFVK